MQRNEKMVGKQEVPTVVNPVTHILKNYNTPYGLRLPDTKFGKAFAKEMRTRGIRVSKVPLKPSYSAGELAQQILQAARKVA